jgi:hypothetical protein
MKWMECNSCGEEFRVITDSEVTVEYCPFCGDDIVQEDDEDLEEDYNEFD